MVNGTTQLPWDGSVENCASRAVSALLDDYVECYHEWRRASEEVVIVRNEVCASTRYYGKHESLIVAAMHVLPKEAAAFTAAESHWFFLLRRAEAIIDVHARMLRVAQAIGVGSECMDVDSHLLLLLSESAGTLSGLTATFAAKPTTQRSAEGDDSSSSEESEAESVNEEDSAAEGESSEEE